MSTFDFDRRLWVVEPPAEATPQPRGDVYSSTERADTWHEPERRMGFTANTPS